MSTIPADQPTNQPGSQCRQPNKRSIVLAMYLIPLCFSLLFWAVQDSSTWPGQGGIGIPLWTRLLIGLWQLCGPFAWVLLETKAGLTAIVATFSAVWFGYLVIVLMTRLRNLSYRWHLILSSLWCASGLPPPGLLIT
jgi:hypothetical protein